MPEIDDGRPPMTTREYREQRNAARQARADQRHRVEDPIRDQLALALHSTGRGWNCPGHGILQEVQDRKYGRLADTALRMLAKAGRLLPDGGETRTEWAVRWHHDGGNGIVLSEQHFGFRDKAEQRGRERIGVYGITRFTIRRREHIAFDDGSSFTGPWVEVTDA